MNDTPREITEYEAKVGCVRYVSSVLTAIMHTPYAFGSPQTVESLCLTLVSLQFNILVADPSTDHSDMRNEWQTQGATGEPLSVQLSGPEFWAIMLAWVRKWQGRLELRHVQALERLSEAPGGAYLRDREIAEVTARLPQRQMETPRPTS